MNYKIIQDEKLLRDFIDWLPELEPDEKFYGSLFARKKYAPNSDLKSDKSKLKRFVTKKEHLFDKLKQMEVEEGTYQISGRPAPQESLAIYLNPNPRNLRQAAFEGIIQLSKLLKDGKKHFDPQSEMLTVIHNTVGRKIYLDFDIDYKPFDPSQLDTFINRDAVEILETRGGFHLLVNLKKIAPEHKSTFYKGMLSLDVDQTGDQMLPIPGCTQGNFIPHFLI